MGNSSSKHKDSLKSYPSFQRSDTQTSQKSTRSSRSRRSLSRDSDTSSFKTATDSPVSTTPIIHSRKNSMNTYTATEGTPVPGPNGSNLPTLNITSPEGGYINMQLPPSMAQVEPRQPILRNNSDALEDLLQSQLEISPRDEQAQAIHTEADSSIHNDNELRSVKAPGDAPHPEDIPKTPLHKNSFSNYSTPFQSPIFGSSALHTNSNQSQLAPNGDSIDLEELIQRLLDAGYSSKKGKKFCLDNNEISLICTKAREIFLSQPTLLELSPPVKIVGDVHGQYGDLIRMFTKCGFPPAANYLFLGDYVDRGKQSLETILLLLCYKIKYPENFFLLRGNHECANVTRVYGFYDECKRRCNIKTWRTFIDTFNTLPLAAIVAGKIFCVHGGLSPVLNSMDEIRNVNRPTDVPDFGLINDLLWSDPSDAINEWEDNERGVSYCFNKVAINKFLARFGFDLVCRAHMVVEDGYEFFNDRSLVTVFSAPNYCGEFDNWGAVMSVSEELLCSFELLDPLDSAALKQVMKKGKQERRIANLASKAAGGSNHGSFSISNNTD